MSAIAVSPLPTGTFIALGTAAEWVHPFLGLIGLAESHYLTARWSSAKGETPLLYIPDLLIKQMSAAASQSVLQKAVNTCSTATRVAARGA